MIPTPVRGCGIAVANEAPETDINGTFVPRPTVNQRLKALYQQIDR